ncbi:polysaccharide lyase [Aureisphaera sp. CAU 1614]|uniref:Polysaccharide lyase n=1 Tax=Halomarinibacterium sedimenti TaxID=2857106 RepID=A0A9X1JV31_9FLAO|nr:heparin lyase I family protein [Halomarinibacterium sedimenti]MBW2937250.1 polysaccharide lyase [Halomarinibacterium sedimenti]
MKNLTFILLLISFPSLAQTYFFEDFDYPDFETLDSLYQNDARNSIWSTKHAVSTIDFNENGVIDKEEEFKNSVIVLDPFNANNKIIRFELQRLDPFFYAKYSCDDSEINNVIPDSLLLSKYNAPKNLYCVDCNLSPLGTGSYEYKTHMNRNEIAIYGNRGDLYKAKKEHWFGLRMLIDENYQIDNLNPGEIVTQFHSRGKKVINPPIALLIVKDRFKLTITKNNDGKGESFDLGPVVKNKWIDWKYRIIISKSDKKGIVEVWKDGEKVLSQEGRNYIKNYPMYLKIGIYKWGWWDCNKDLNETSYKAISFDKVWADDKDMTQN